MHRLSSGKVHKDPCSIPLTAVNRGHILISSFEKENKFHGDVQGFFGCHNRQHLGEKVSGNLK